MIGQYELATDTPMDAVFTEVNADEAHTDAARRLLSACPPNGQRRPGAWSPDSSTVVLAIS
jgi:hypothetical protein